jgi:hypothetical protein
MPSVYVGPVKPVSSVPVQYQACAKLVGLPVQVPVEQTRGFPSASPRCTAISHVVWWSASSAMLPVVSTLPQLKSARRATCHMHDGSIFQILRRASRLLWSSPQLRPVLAAVRRCCTAATPLVMATALIPSVALGEGWTIRPTGLPTGINTGSLSSVSCLSATLCIAVGGASDFNGNVTNAVVLAEMWNGIGWIPMPVPGPSGDVPSLRSPVVGRGRITPHYRRSESGGRVVPLCDPLRRGRLGLAVVGQPHPTLSRSVERDQMGPLSAKDPGTRYGARLDSARSPASRRRIARRWEQCSTPTGRMKLRTRSSNAGTVPPGESWGPKLQHWDPIEARPSQEFRAWRRMHAPPSAVLSALFRRRTARLSQSAGTAEDGRLLQSGIQPLRF